MTSPIHQLNRFLIVKERELTRTGDAPPGLLPLLAVGRFVTTVAVEFYDDRCFQMAAALSYTALLALVPVTSLFFSIFTAFQAFQNLRNKIESFITQHLFFENVMMRENILQYLDQFSSNSRQVGLLSLVALIVTVISLMITVENSLNSIWKTPGRRTLLTRVITYSALVFLAPISIALSLYITNLTFGAVIEELSGRLALWRFISGLSISWLMFWMIYMVVPETKVHIRPALLGAAVAGLFFEWAKWSFGQYIQASAYYSGVYSTLAVVPIFLVWLYLTWLIALFGMEITYVYQNRDNLRSYARSIIRDGEVTEAPLIATMCQIAREYHDGTPERANPHQLSSALGLPLHRLSSILVHLEEKGFIHRVADTDDQYQPNRLLDQISLEDVHSSLHTDQILLRVSRSDRRFEALRDVFLRSSEYRRELLERITLEDIVRWRPKQGR